MRSAAIHLQRVQRYTSQQKAYKKQRQGIIRIQSLSRGITTRRLAKQLRAAVRVQSGLRALIARKKVLLKRRNMRATTIQSVARKRSKRKQFKKMQSATLQLQSNQRMAQQRRVYRRELNEKKVRLVGDCLLAAAFLSYTGAFNFDFRQTMLREVWEPDVAAGT